MTKKKKVPAKPVTRKPRRKTTPRRNPTTDFVQSALDFLTGMQRRPQKEVVLDNLSYHDTLHLILEFAGSIMQMYVKELTPFEKERLNICSREIMNEILREKYSLPAPEAGILLLNLGADLLHTVEVQREINGHDE